MTVTREPLRLRLLPDAYALCRLAADVELPSWAGGDFVAVTRTADELSVVCPQQRVPDGVRAEAGWRCWRVVDTLDFALVGVLAALLEPLARAGISVFAVSTFDTDYLLVKEADRQRAVAAWRTAGHEVI